jgi:hypothetical protein
LTLRNILEQAVAHWIDFDCAHLFVSTLFLFKMRVASIDTEGRILLQSLDERKILEHPLNFAPHTHQKNKKLNIRWSPQGRYLYFEHVDRTFLYDTLRMKELLPLMKTKTMRFACDDSWFAIREKNQWHFFNGDEILESVECKDLLRHPQIGSLCIALLENDVMILHNGKLTRRMSCEKIFCDWKPCNDKAVVVLINTKTVSFWNAESDECSTSALRLCGRDNVRIVGYHFLDRENIVVDEQDVEDYMSFRYQTVVRLDGLPAPALSREIEILKVDPNGINALVKTIYGKAHLISVAQLFGPLAEGIAEFPVPDLALCSIKFSRDGGFVAYRADHDSVTFIKNGTVSVTLPYILQSMEAPYLLLRELHTKKFCVFDMEIETFCSLTFSENTRDAHIAPIPEPKLVKFAGKQ